MNLRWLVGNFAEPRYGLSRAEQWKVSNLAHRKYMPSKRFFGWGLPRDLVLYEDE